MGAVFSVPYARLDSWPRGPGLGPRRRLHAARPHPGREGRHPRRGRTAPASDRVALMLGAEGDGLSTQALVRRRRVGPHPDGRTASTPSTSQPPRRSPSTQPGETPDSEAFLSTEPVPLGTRHLAGRAPPARRCPDGMQCWSIGEPRTEYRLWTMTLTGSPGELARFLGRAPVRESESGIRSGANLDGMRRGAAAAVACYAVETAAPAELTGAGRITALGRRDPQPTRSASPRRRR